MTGLDGETETGLAASPPATWAAPLALGLASTLLCCSVVVAIFSYPFLYLGRKLDPVWQPVVGQIGFSGPGVIFGLAFATLLVWRLGARWWMWAGLPLAGAVTWLIALNLGVYLVSPPRPVTEWTYWAGPLCGGVGGLIMALLVAALFAPLRSLRFVVGAAAIGAGAGLLPTEWDRIFTSSFDPAWLPLFLVWQCGILLLASYLAAGAAGCAAMSEAQPRH